MRKREPKKKYPKATTITTMSVAFGSIRNVHAIDTDRETIGVVGVAVSYILCAWVFVHEKESTIQEKKKKMVSKTFWLKTWTIIEQKEKYFTPETFNFKNTIAAAAILFAIAILSMSIFIHSNSCYSFDDRQLFRGGRTNEKLQWKKAWMSANRNIKNNAIINTKQLLKFNTKSNFYRNFVGFFFILTPF